MPNLAKPITTVDLALAYQQRILNALQKNKKFQPLMTLYLTSDTTPEEIIKAQKTKCIFAIKLFPAGATTNSSAGVQKLEDCFTVFETMEKIGMPLSVHGEVTDKDVDIFDREKVFLNKFLKKIITRFQGLKVILEHVTTEEAIDFVKEGPETLAATITPHHLSLNRNDLLVGGIKPHLYCFPILKGEKHQKKLLETATSGHPRFFLGTDSAPHPQSSKEAAKGSAGIYSAFLSLPLYAQIFDSLGKIDKLEDFAGVFGANFYGLPKNNETITLIKSKLTIPETIKFGDQLLVPLKAGEVVEWQLKT